MLKALKATLLLLSVFALTLPTAQAESFWDPQGTGYPRLGSYLTGIPGGFGGMTSSEKYWLMQHYNFFAVKESPEVVAEMRSINEDATICWQQMANFIRDVLDENDQWTGEYLPSSDWHFTNYVTNVANENDWILRRDDGRAVRTWGWVWMDLVPNGRLGTVGDATGLTAAEWLANVAFPNWIEEHGWGPDSASYNCWIMEVIADHAWAGWLGSQCQPEECHIDMDRDGEAETFEEFNAALEETITQFMNDLRANIGWDFPLIAGGDSFTPDLENFQGIKMEDFLWRFRDPDGEINWDEEFHGVVSRQRGYEVAKNQCIEEERLTILEMEMHPENNEHEDEEVRSKRMRFGFGTSLLLDGWFMYNTLHWAHPELDLPKMPYTIPEYFIQYGNYASPYTITHFPAGDVYSREFFKTEEDRDSGKINWTVKVNPNLWTVDGIPAKDASFEKQIYYYNVNGRITVEGVGLPGVEITASQKDSASSSVVTDANGYYSFGELVEGTQLLLTPTKEGYTFDPEDFLVKLIENIEVDFIAFPEDGGDLDDDDDDGGSQGGRFSNPDAPVVTNLKKKKRKHLVKVEMTEVTDANYEITIQKKRKRKRGKRKRRWRNMKAISSATPFIEKWLRCGRYRISYRIVDAAEASEQSPTTVYKSCRKPK